MVDQLNPTTKARPNVNISLRFPGFKLNTRRYIPAADDIGREHYTRVAYFN